MAATDVARAAPGTRTVWLVVVLGGCELLFAALLTYAGFYYSIPPLVTAALAILGGAVVALLVLAMKSARRRLLTVLAVFAVTVVVLAVSVFLTLVMPVPNDTRVRQIGEAAGFTLMVPAGLEIEARSQDGYGPSSNLSTDGEFTAHYARFDVSERRSDIVKSASALEAAARLEQPDPQSQTTIVLDQKKAVTVLGKPGWAVVWHEAMAGKMGGSGALLVFQPNGLVVRMSSDNTDGNGLTADELVKVAQTFAPVT